MCFNPNIPFNHMFSNCTETFVYLRAICPHGSRSMAHLFANEIDEGLNLERDPGQLINHEGFDELLIAYLQFRNIYLKFAGKPLLDIGRSRKQMKVRRCNHLEKSSMFSLDSSLPPFRSFLTQDLVRKNAEVPLNELKISYGEDIELDEYIKRAINAFHDGVEKEEALMGLESSSAQNIQSLISGREQWKAAERVSAR